MEKSGPCAEDRQLHVVLRKYWYVPVFFVILILAALFLAGSWHGQSKATGQRAAESRRILYYVDPMNPAHTSPEPGLAPCGMKMEPVFAENEGQTAGSALPPGSIKITPEKQQIIGVRVATTEKSPYTYTLRTVGKVVADETRTYRVNAYSEGFVTKVYNVSTGSLVRKDEPLAAVYSKDLFTALQTYYYAIYALDNLQQGTQLPASQRNLLEAQKRSAEYALMNLGVSSQQIKDLIRSKEITQEIILSARATSFVLARKVTPGQKFISGEELFLLADLSRVWVVADLFENEAQYVRPGENVRVTSPHQGGTHQATVSEVLPEFDPATLTVKVRLELDNPEFTLRPGMFVDVDFPIKKAPTINVPVDAIMNSGLNQIVFVDRGNGYFEPRRVKIGWRLGDRAEIVEGLNPGERIVVSGNFLIDSESRMRLAAAGFFGNVVKDPVCGLNLDEGKASTAGLKSNYQGKTYYFCSDECQKKFDKMPARFGTKPETGPVPEVVVSASKTPAAPEEVSEKAKDPACGLLVAMGPAKLAGRTSEYQGKIYYFDTDGCKERFDKDPQHYLSGGSEATIARPFSPVPTNPDLLLRLRRDSIRAIPAGKGQALVEDPVQKSLVKPATPTGPPQPMDPGAVPGVPPAMPPGGAQVAPPAATPASPQGPAAVKSPERTPAAPQVQPAPPIPRDIQPQPPQKTPSPPQPASPTCPPGHGDH